ncbi:hypothetical protein HPP92_012057 [Vanilla planifolia]|uniref:Uncharacterized protein n=1 Tax=Vanilla planifolia TaxID=51239 RepID=A0A835R314_VANPL|nr:hypothetical protein HPP92_012057 [Vanilla planifolia]
MVKEHLACVDDQNSGKIKLTLEAGSGALYSELELLRAAFDTADFVNVSSAMKESDLTSSLQKTNADFLELELRLVNMERELHAISEMNKELKEEMEKEKAGQVDSELKLIRANMDLRELKAILLDKETELQAILDENEQLKSQRARAAELEVSRRLDFLNAEAEKKQQDGKSDAHSLNSSGGEFRDGSRIAEVEAAVRPVEKSCRNRTVMFASGDHGVIERTSSVDAEYNSTTGKLKSSPFLDVLDETSPKKKNNVLRKISGLWKKGPK